MDRLEEFAVLRDYLVKNEADHGELQRQHESLQSRMDRLNQSMDEHLDSEKRIENMIVGNGVPGLNERLRVQEAFTDSLRRWFWVVVPMITLGTGSLIWLVIQDTLTRRAAE